jgi:hypothetical protein
MALSVQLTSTAVFRPVPVGWLAYLIGASKAYNYKHQIPYNFPYRYFVDNVNALSSV